MILVSRLIKQTLLRSDQSNTDSNSCVKYQVYRDLIVRLVCYVKKSREQSEGVLGERVVAEWLRRRTSASR